MDGFRVISVPVYISQQLRIHCNRLYSHGLEECEMFLPAEHARNISTNKAKERIMSRGLTYFSPVVLRVTSDKLAGLMTSHVDPTSKKCCISLIPPDFVTTRSV